MIETILTAADIPARAARFPDPPEVHAIYFDSINTDGPDHEAATTAEHDCTVELYAPSIQAGDEALHRLQTQLEARGIRYTTQGWYWLDAIRRYQEVVEFSHIEKI